MVLYMLAAWKYFLIILMSMATILQLSLKWDNILYHDHRHTDSVYAPNYELYSNSSSGAYDKAPKGTERKYLYASVYRIVPDFLKNKMKILNATTGSDIWDFKFLNVVILIIKKLKFKHKYCINMFWRYLWQ